MKGSKVTAELELRKNLVSEEHGFEEVGTTVDNAVTDSLDLVHVGNNTRFGIGEVLNYDVGSNSVVGHGNINLDLLAGFALSVLDASVDTDSLTNTLCENGFGSGVEELILKGRGTCVNN